MVSIAESMRGLNGDGWGTTISEEEQLAHQEYVKKMNLGGGLNADYEHDRERQMEEMRLGLGLKPDFNRERDLAGMKTSFINPSFLRDTESGFLGKEKAVFDINSVNKLNQLINKIKFEHIEDMNNLRKTMETMSKRITELETQVKELGTRLSKPGFFKRIANYFSCLGR